jgi:hypothetical protein
MRGWMGANILVLAGLSAWILIPSATSPAPEDRPAETAGMPSVSPTPAPEPPTKAEVLDISGLRFGVSAPDVPWSRSKYERIAASAGAPPTLIQFFVHWPQDYPSETVELAYQRQALPVLSWEPWAGSTGGTRQPEYALARIIDGEFDEYLRGFADALREHGWPVAIRLAHEMNGHWYPWSERAPYNEQGDYVKAWRHVYDVFEDAGAGNVIWLWSPNILRAVPGVSLEALYPGDSYVDWIGMVGYSVGEDTAAAVFGPTLDALRAFTDKPLVITETGVEPGGHKVPWIEDLFTWFAEHPDVIGFIWFEYTTEQGGHSDWRFTSSPETREAFRNGLLRVELAAPPVELAGG